MASKILTVIMAAATAACLAACTNQPPKCSDADTFSLIREIILNQMGGSAGLTPDEIQENMKIEFPRASAFDENIKKYTCEAKLLVGQYELPITYESQLDDNKEHIVMVGGIGQGDLHMLQAGLVEVIKKSRAGKEGAPKPPAVPSAQEPVDPPAVSHASIVDTDPTTAISSDNTQAQASPPTWTPSFDCSKAANFSEKAVCSDVLLGKLDGALSQNYKYMMASDIGDGARNDLKQTQKSWLAERNKCVDIQCLTDAYHKRVDEICEYPVISGVHPICTGSDDIK